MSTAGPCLLLRLGQAVRRVDDPSGVVGVVVGVVFREPGEVLVRWGEEQSSVERRDALIEAL